MNLHTTGDHELGGNILHALGKPLCSRDNKRQQTLLLVFLHTGQLRHCQPGQPRAICEKAVNGRCRGLCGPLVTQLLRAPPLACKIIQTPAFPAHSLRYQEGPPINRLSGQSLRAEGCWVELDKLHVGHGCLGAVRHGHAIACRHTRIGGDWVHLQVCLVLVGGTRAPVDIKT